MILNIGMDEMHLLFDSFAGGADFDDSALPKKDDALLFCETVKIIQGNSRM